MRNTLVPNIFDAVASGSVESIKHYIGNSGDLNVVRRSHTPLMFAVTFGNMAIIQLLVEHGANINYVSITEETALSKAIVFGNIEVVAYLLDNGANIKYEYNGLSMLALASLNGHTEIVLELLNRKVDINECVLEGWSSLMFAAKNGHLKTVQALIDRGANVNHKNDRKESALTTAAVTDRVDVAKLLIENGVSIDQPNCDGITPMMLAISQGYVNTPKLLIERGANIDAVDSDGCWFALGLAAHNNCKNQVKMLLEHGANINLINSAKRTALALAASAGNTQIVSLLLKHDAKVSHDNINWSALMYAIREGHTDVVSLLIKIDPKVRVDAYKALMLKAALECKSAPMLKLIWPIAKPKLIEDLQVVLTEHTRLMMHAYHINVDIRLELSGEIVNTFIKHVISQRQSSEKITYANAFQSFALQLTSLLHSHLKPLGIAKRFKNYLDNKTQHVLHLTANINPRSIDFDSNVETMLAKITQVIHEAQRSDKKEKDKKMQIATWRKLGVNNISFNQDGSIKLGDEVALAYNTSIDARHFITLLDLENHKIMCNDDILNMSNDIIQVIASIHNKSSQVKQQLKALKSLITKQSVIVDIFSKDFHSFASISSTYMALTKTCSQVDAKSKHLQDLLKLQLDRLDNLDQALLFRVDSEGKLFVKKPSSEWALGCSFLQQERDAIGLLITECDNVCEKVINHVRTQLLQIANKTLKSCKDSIHRFSLETHLPKPLDTQLSQLCSSREILKEKYEGVLAYTKLASQEPNYSLQDLQTFAQKLAQLVTQKHEFDLFVNKNSAQKISQYREKMIHYGIVNNAFNKAEAYFKGQKQKIPEALKSMIDELKRLKKIQQNIRSDIWVGKVRALCRPKGSRIPNRLVFSASIPAPIVNNKRSCAIWETQVLVINQAQRDRLEEIRNIALKLQDCQQIGLIAIKRSLVRHYVAILNSPKARVVHNMLGHQFQFHTDKDSNLIDCMFELITRNDLSYTACIDQLANLVKGIDRLDTKEEQKIIWSSLKEGGQRPIDIMNNSLNVLRTPVDTCSKLFPNDKTCTDPDFNEIIAAYRKVDALFTLSKLWKTATNKRSLLMKLRVGSCLDLEGEIEQYITYRNEFRHNDSLLLQNIRQVCLQLFAHNSYRFMEIS